MTFTDRMQSVLSYAPVFIEDYGLRFVNVCTRDIVEDTISLHFLAETSRATRIRYIRAGRMMNKHQDISSFL